MDISQFGKWARGTGKTVSENADKLVRKCALAIDTAVVYACPVDTGRARSNFQVGINAPVQGVIDTLGGVNKGFKGTGNAVAQRSIDRARLEIAKYKGDSTDAAIYISNNLHYIAKLNDGHSPQASPRFIERAVMVGVQAIQGSKLVESVTVK